MNRIIKTLKGLLLGAVLAAGVLVAPAARADDAVTLKDGRVLRGEIVKEVEGSVWIRYAIGGIEQTQFVAAGDIAKIERDAVSTPAPEAAPAIPAGARPRREGVPRLAVLTLGEGGDKDMVGQYMTAKAIRDCIPLLEQDGVTDLILLVNSGGGYTLEVQRLSDVIQNELKPKFRVVAWIRWAISAAAMTSHTVEEIYFMPEAAYGACTEWSGGLVATKGRDFVENVYETEYISSRGNHHPFIMKAMQGNANDQEEGFPLSCDIDPVTGEVTWYQNEEGDYIVNPRGKVLTFDSEQAAKYRFSKGTAATIDELARLMGYEEVEWVGTPKKGFIYPICRAEEVMMKYRDKAYEDQRMLNDYWINYQSCVQLAAGTQDRKDRGLLVGKAREYLNDIKAMVKNNPNYGLFIFGMLQRQWDEWVDLEEKRLRDLLK